MTGTLPIDEQFTDDGAGATCGFPVSHRLVGTGRFIAWFDAQGELTRAQIHTNDTGTMSANGITWTSQTTTPRPSTW